MNEFDSPIQAGYPLRKIEWPPHYENLAFYIIFPSRNAT